MREEMSLMGHAADLPAGDVVQCPPMPVLSSAHTTRLRKLWSFGRPVHLSELTGIEFDLAVHGLVEPVPGKLSTTAILTVTQRGVVHLNEARQATVAAQSPHHELGQRLAAHLRAKGFHTWENIEFGNPDERSTRTWGVVRPDVYACKPVLRARNAAPAIYEVKVRRADFLADLAKPEKRGAYADIAEAVYYCCPDGLIAKSEVPDGFGLLCAVENGQFVLRKTAKRAKGFVLQPDTALTLMVKRQVPLGVGD